MREKIVYIENSGIGNAILSTPCLKAIKSIKPNCELIYIGWNRSNRVLEGLSFIDTILSSDHGPRILNNCYPSIDHLIISPVGSIESLSNELIKLSKNKYKLNIGPCWGKHEVEFKMEFAKKLGFIGETPTTEMSIFEYNIEEAKEFVKDIKKDIICVSVANNKMDHWSLKFWGHQNFAKLIDSLQLQYPNFDIVLLGGQEDKSDAESVLGLVSSNKNVYNAVGVFADIKTSAALIGMSKILIGSDNAPQHIAAALNVPTVTIFLFTSIIKNRPFNKNALIAANNCDKRIFCQHNVNNIGECYKNGCLNVNLEKVLAKIKEILWQKSSQNIIPSRMQ